MLQPLFKKSLPHLIAILTFLVLSVMYCRPALEGKVLQQHDIVHWKGMAQSSIEYKEKNGHFPLWNTNLFSGMPGYQVSIDGNDFLPNMHGLLTLGLPKPISFFFLACLTFYILSQVLGVHYLIGILTSLGFAYASYNPIIIVAGHESKMWAMAYMPGALAGLMLIYNKRYLLGLAIAAIFGTWQVAFNHPQISYYFFIAVGIISLGYLVQWIRAKEWKHAAIASGLALLIGFIAFANSSLILLTTQEYAKYTMRGGKSIQINGSDIKEVNTKGLDLDYAFSYSIAKDEILTFIMPNVFGGGSGEVVGENEAFIASLTANNVPEQSALQLAGGLPKYWGGIEEGTAGAVYLGAIVVFLALIGLVVVKNNIKWWILGASVIAIFFAWGKYFPGFNTFLFHNFPLYNKFRAPSMALIVPQLLLPVLAAMALHQLFFAADAKEVLARSYKKILYVFGGLFALLGIMYLMNDYSGSIDPRIVEAYTNPQNGDASGGRMIVAALQSARKAMFAEGIGRVFLYAALVLGLLFLYLKNLLKPIAVVAIFLVANTIDLLVVDNKYLNADNYLEAESYEANNFAPTPVDQEILKDKDPHFRVYNLAPDRFSDAITSYHHRSVGGYHAAKLAIYQDLIEGQLSKSPLNMGVLNMLDTRYLIVPASEQRPAASVERNPGSLGAVWFIKHIQYVNGPVEEMKALDNLNTRDTVVIDKSWESVTGGRLVPDSTASIRLVQYDNDAIRYESNANSDQFAVFSEVYYPAGWNAYIDGKQVPYAKVNYVLRGMKVPSGKHQIEFRFEPASYSTAQKLTYIGNSLFWICILLGVFSIWRQFKKGTLS